MANYNPNFPNVVGNEWVPIRSEPVTLSFDQEVGTTFDLAADATVTTGRFYLDQVPADLVAQVPLMSVYPLGAEADTGAVSQVDVPVTAGTIAGGGSLVGAATATAAVASPADGSFIVLPAGASVDLSFGVTAAGATLTGKRIVGVELVYSAATSEAAGFAGVVSIKDTTANPALGYGQLELFEQGLVPRLSSLTLGEINPFLLGHPSASSQRWPWIYPQLQRFDSGAANKLTVTVFSTQSDTYLRYAVLRVTFCEENRVAVGGAFTASAPYVAGGNAVELRSAATLAAGGVALRAGAYTVTVTVSQQGTETITGLVPAVRQLRQLYALPRLSGIVLTRPGRAGQVARQVTDTLPQLSLHTAAAAVTGVHSYGTLLPVPVFGTQVVRQDITIPTSQDFYAYVRFYARRVGIPGGPLTVRPTAQPPRFTTITVAALDALPEIVDGWREITASFPSGQLPLWLDLSTWEWSAPAATAANHWQILAVRAIGGTGAAALGPATYGGDVRRLSTGPSTSPIVVSDGDVSLMFLIKPELMARPSVLLSTQGLTRFTDDCDREPPGTLRALRYHNVITEPVNLPGGQVEIQRRDDVDSDWRDIMRTPANGQEIRFADYEARVGVTSQYRARAVTAHGIGGLWSNAGVSELPQPGVFGPAQDRTVLIFTSNARQDGSANLAYATAFERTSAEEFTFVEDDQVTYQRMYGRDLQVAFHGTERGGVQFSRTLVVHAAAVPAPSLPNMQSLRDLAWADLPYVCVRDELGNRWFASVAVPSGVVRNRRRLYLARVDITEVSTVPFPVPAVS